jgi:phosphoglycerate dehydrogenase-like enzyme
MSVRVLNLVGRDLANRVAAAFPAVEVVGVRPNEQIPEDVAGDVLVAFPRAARQVAVLAPRVRWMHVMGTGIDWLPDEAFDAPMLTCARGGSSVAISEFVLAAMLAFEKQLPELWARPPEEVFTHASLGGLNGRRLGLVGLGGIGQAVATRAVPFGMAVSAARRHPIPFGDVTIAPLDEVLTTADHLVLTAPVTPETIHVIGPRTVGMLKHGVHLVNIARGKLIDQEALRPALDDGRVARATLDVCDPEPLAADHWMHTHPRVRLTGHLSWSSPAGMEPLVQAFLDNLGRFVRGEALTGTVDPGERY